jgi:hypothetical protein
MRAALDGTAAGVTFAEGHELDADHAARVPRNRIGTMLSRDEAAALLDRIERGQAAPPATADDPQGYADLIAPPANGPGAEAWG